MRTLLPILFALLILSGAGGLYALYTHLNSDAVQTAQTNTDEGGLADMFRDLVDSAKSDAGQVQRIDISSVLPEARAGWFRKDYANADGEALTGRDIIHSAVTQSDSNGMLLVFETDAARARGHAAYTYLRGDLRLLVRVRAEEKIDLVREGETLALAIQRNMGGIILPQPAPQQGLFATMDSVAFVQQEPVNFVRRENKTYPTDYRVFNANIADHVTVQIMTNASDNAVAELIKTIDIQSVLTQMGMQPAVPGFTTPLAEPLSQVRPDMSVQNTASETPQDVTTDDPAVAQALMEQINSSSQTRPVVAGGETVKPTVRRGTGSGGFTGAGACSLVDGARRCTIGGS